MLNSALHILCEVIWIARTYADLLIRGSEDALISPKVHDVSLGFVHVFISSNVCSLCLSYYWKMNLSSASAASRILSN